MSVKLFRRKDARPLPDSGSGWVMRMRSGALDAAERAEIERWLAASPDNARDLLRAEAAWRLSGVLEADQSVQRDLAQLDALRAEFAAHNKEGRTKVWISLAAAAGVAAIGLTIWFLLTPAQFHTARGEQRVVRLADGSVITLNTDTRLTAELSATSREIQLERGEALFQVTQDTRRPFVVRAGAGSARVLGTRFNVLAQDGGAVVSVLEGKVQVEVKEKRLLGAGQSAAYTAQGRLVAPEPMQASPERISAWREGKLRFESCPLDRAVREYNRYAKKPVRLQVGPASNIRISGVFRIGDSTTFVDALGELVGASVSDRGDMLLLQSPHLPPAR